MITAIRRLFGSTLGKVIALGFVLLTLPVGIVFTHYSRKLAVKR